MKIKDIFKNIAFLLVFLISGLSSGMALTMYLFDTLPLMDQATVPENPVAIVVFPGLALNFCTFAVIFFSVMLFSLKKKVKLSSLLFCKKERKRCIVLRSAGYLIIARLVYESIRDIFEFKQFFINGLWYYASAVVFVLSGMMIFIAIVKKQ